mmetsp:Transcript_12570/g.29794  ORF Transcript_12570/g.29794 Transcript_12570/m.29794 type:complete len:226 (+) Transcript_12570:1677-2354(+)
MHSDIRHHPHISFHLPSSPWSKDRRCIASMHSLHFSCTSLQQHPCRWYQQYEIPHTIPPIHRRRSHNPSPKRTLRRCHSFSWSRRRRNTCWVRSHCSSGTHLRWHPYRYQWWSLHRDSDRRRRHHLQWAFPASPHWHHRRHHRRREDPCYYCCPSDRRRRHHLQWAFPASPHWHHRRHHRRREDPCYYCCPSGHRRRHHPCRRRHHHHPCPSSFRPGYGLHSGWL